MSGCPHILTFTSVHDSQAEPLIKRHFTMLCIIEVCEENK
jgi:hypothetical protein